MFTLNSKELGQSISQEILEQLINTTQVTEYNNQRIGNYVAWSKGPCEVVENSLHLNLAPEGSSIIINVHYEGHCTLHKKDGVWYIVNKVA